MDELQGMRRRFGPDFVEAYCARFGGRPPDRRPLTYDLAVLPEFEARRAWFETQLALLPDEQADKLANKLWLDEHIWPVTFELATGATLRAAGFTVAYERQYDGLTPDWTALSSEGRPVMFVEVHTDEPAKGTYGRLRAWRSLELRVAEIPCPVILVLDGKGTPTSVPRPPDAKTGKQITRELRRRLLSSGFPPLRIPVGDYTFRVLANEFGPLPSPLGMRAQFAAPSGVAGVVSAKRLSERVQKKVSTYAKLAERYQVPLVVAIGAHRFTGVDLTHLDDLLAGNPTVEVQFNIGDTFIGRHTMNPGRPDRWEMPPSLSGILWISNEPPFTATARPNIAALRATPAALGHGSSPG